MSPNWTHTICVECWVKREPHKLPATLSNADVEICCFCQKETRAGIYIREDPAKTLCKGACQT